MCCRHYGRYVDDAYVVSDDLAFLKHIIPDVNSFLKEVLGLTLSFDKVRVFSVYQGVEFLCAFLKPHRAYVSRDALNRMKKKIDACKSRVDYRYMNASVKSFLGVLSHYNSFCIMRVLFGYLSHYKKYGRF